MRRPQLTVEKVQRSSQAKPVKARAVIWAGAWAWVQHNIHHQHHVEICEELTAIRQLIIMTTSNSPRCSLWRQFLAETLGKQTLSLAGRLSEIVMQEHSCWSSSALGPLLSPFCPTKRRELSCLSTPGKTFL